MNQVKHTEILEYIRKHPGMPTDRLCWAFRRDLHWTLKKLEDLRKVRVEYADADPDFLRKKKYKIYFAKRS